MWRRCSTRSLYAAPWRRFARSVMKQTWNCRWTCRVRRGRKFPIPRTIQQDGNLGVRLLAALERALSAGHPNVLILGSDSPTLPGEHIRCLLNCDADVALGPTNDGGYYGIACRRIDPAMLWVSDVHPWYALDTIRSVESCGMSCAIGPDGFTWTGPKISTEYLAAKQTCEAGMCHKRNDSNIDDRRTRVGLPGIEGHSGDPDAHCVPSLCSCKEGRPTSESDGDQPSAM